MFDAGKDWNAMMFCKPTIAHDKEIEGYLPPPGSFWLSVESTDVA